MLLGGAAAWVHAQNPLPPPTTDAQGTAQVVITGDIGRLAIADCVPRAGDGASREACATITQTLRRDLDFEGLFQFVGTASMAALPAQNPDLPNFADWRSVGAGTLVTTRASVVGGQLTADFVVYHVPAGQVVLARKYSGPVDTPRIFAHTASDEIVERVGQQRGVAHTKIAFISDRDASAKVQTKQVYLVDYDGYNAHRLTVDRSLNLTPSWSPLGGVLSYVSYGQGSPDVVASFIREGRRTNLSGGKGQNFSPAVSPDGRRIAFASSRSGNMEVWTVDVDGTNLRKLTNHPAADTAPTWSPTGSEIAFTSSRAGTPQIYVMDAEGLNVRRLTNVGNWNDGAAWNPSKQFSEIAYTSRLEGGFEIAVVDLATRQVRQVTTGRGSCESPSWAPSGRHLVFSCSRGGKWQITVSDRMGSRVQALSTGAGNNVQPDWGP